MANGTITITLDGVTTTQQSLVLQIQDGAFVLADGPATSVSNITGFTGVSLAPSAVAFTAPTGTAIGGTLTLTATRGAQDPALTLSGFTSAPGMPMVAWQTADGGMEEEDLSSGQVVLGGFGG